MSGPVIYPTTKPSGSSGWTTARSTRSGPTMQQALNEAIDHADRDNVGALVIAGNQRVFSGGFDLKILTSGEAAARDRHAPGRL